MRGKCEVMIECEGDKKASFICPECDSRYCSKCASTVDYECDCITPPRLVRIRK